MSARRRLCWAAFLGLAVLVGLGSELFLTEAPPPPVVEPRGARVPPPAAASAPPPALPVTVAANSAPADLFAVHRWDVAETQRAPAPTVSASAPPLPFRVLGRLDDRQAVRVFLLQGERLHSVRVGDVIDRTYRVERIHATEMTLTYLPLQVAQSLPMGNQP